MTTATRPTYYILDHAYRERNMPGVEPLWIETVSLTCPTEDDARAKAEAIRAAYGDTTAEHRFAVRRVGGAR